MSYRVIWHSLLVDGSLEFCTYRQCWTAKLACWWLNRTAGRIDGERVRWFVVERVEKP